MSEIAVACDQTDVGWTCRVEVDDGGTRTVHVVRVAPEDLARFAPGGGAPEALVRASFEFLLEREPASSILRAFDLPVIGRYFPAFEAEIGRRLEEPPATQARDLGRRHTDAGSRGRPDRG